MARITLWLFVIALGLNLGAGLYETRVVVPLWSGGVPDTLAADNPYARVAIDAGMHFWAFLTPAVAGLAVLALIAGLRTAAPQFGWRLFAEVAELCVVASTLLYFRPTLVRLFMGHGAGIAPASLSATVQTWVRWSLVRVGISFVAWCAALRALSLT